MTTEVQAFLKYGLGLEDDQPCEPEPWVYFDGSTRYVVEDNKFSKFEERHEEHSSTA